jgi:glycosyltransferase involved in cell wall biosynthesis
MLPTNPLVSIIIPVYNRESLILETLESAQNQTYPNMEIVIVDNKSTDNTWELLLSEAEKDQRIRLFQNDTNLGPVRNWQKCIDYAKGEYIKILWSDDSIEPTFVEETMALFDEDVAFVITGIKITEQSQLVYQSTFQTQSTYSTKAYLDDILTYNKRDFPMSPGCAMFRKKDLEKNLLIDIPNEDSLDFSRYGAGNDLLIFLLTANDKSYSKIRCVSNYLSKFKSHGDSITIKNGATIKIYYDWSMCYFINTHYQHKRIKSIFKTSIYLFYRNKTTKTNLHAQLTGPLNIPFLLHRARKKLLSKIG